LSDSIDRETILFRHNLGARLSSFVEIIGKKSDAAAAAAVSVEQLNKWIKGSVKVPVEALRLISEAANGDFGWLATGIGTPPHTRPLQVRTAARPALSVEHDPARKPNKAVGTNIDSPGMFTIPRYNEVRPSAGPGSQAISEAPTTRMAFEQSWLVDLGVKPESAVILPAQGDSMEPTIMNGAPMLVDTSKREVRNGFIYVFDIAGDLMVKRIERLPDGTINLLSDNSSKYPSRNLDRESVAQMTVIGRVYAAVSKF
jgi:phage repressor protein C with HTH and peptisase S24 domain